MPVPWDLILLDSAPAVAAVRGVVQLVNRRRRKTDASLHSPDEPAPSAPEATVLTEAESVADVLFGIEPVAGPGPGGPPALAPGAENKTLVDHLKRGIDFLLKHAVLSISALGTVVVFFFPRLGSNHLSRAVLPVNIPLILIGVFVFLFLAVRARRRTNPVGSNLAIWLRWTEAALIVAFGFAYSFYNTQPNLATCPQAQPFTNPGWSVPSPPQCKERHSSNYAAPLTQRDALYFSFTVMSTTGLGDIAPISENARLDVLLEMICSMALVAVGLGIIWSLGGGTSTSRNLTDEDVEKLAAALVRAIESS